MKISKGKEKTVMTIGEVIELLKGIFEALVELFTAYFAKSEEGEGSTEEV